MRRKWYARLLLAVFVPMLLLSLVHVHEQGMVEEATCADCAHHVHHSHLASADYCMDSCVLCQMLSLSFIAAVLLLIALFSAKGKDLPLQTTAFLVSGYANNKSCRAPPYYSFLLKM